MVKYYFELNYVIFYRFDEVDKENVEDRYFIGYFSSKKNAMDAIQKCLKFDNMVADNFQIIRRKIIFEEEPKILYQVGHEYSIETLDDKYIDYSYIFNPKATFKEANELCESLRKKKKYKWHKNRIYYNESSDGFEISEHEIDKFFFNGLYGFNEQWLPPSKT